MKRNEINLSELIARLRRAAEDAAARLGRPGILYIGTVKGCAKSMQAAASDVLRELAELERAK